MIKGRGTANTSTEAGRIFSGRMITETTRVWSKGFYSSQQCAAENLKWSAWTMIFSCCFSGNKKKKHWMCGFMHCSHCRHTHTDKRSISLAPCWSLISPHLKKSTEGIFACPSAVRLKIIRAEPSSNLLDCQKAFCCLMTTKILNPGWRASCQKLKDHNLMFSYILANTEQSASKCVHVWGVGAVFVCLYC